jgi:hypothetical protein
VRGGWEKIPSRKGGDYSFEYPLEGDNAGERKRRTGMFKVKTFGMEIRPLKTMHELADLDEMVNRFIAESGARRVISVSDVATTDDTGETIGLIRILCYEM